MMRKKRHDAVEWSCCGFSSKNNLRISAINFYCAIFQELSSVLPLLMHFFSPSADFWTRTIEIQNYSTAEEGESNCVGEISRSRVEFYFTVAGSRCILFHWDMCAHERRTDKSAIKFSTELECRWTVDMRMRYFRQVRAYGRRVDSSVLLARALYGIIKYRWMIFITNDLSKWELYAL